MESGKLKLPWEEKYSGHSQNTVIAQHNEQKKEMEVLKLYSN